jgi:ATP phosphoribosyltransferase
MGFDGAFPLFGNLAILFPAHQVEFLLGRIEKAGAFFQYFLPGVTRHDADLIIDLVSTGTTLRDNRLKALSDGLVLQSQACLVANRTRLTSSTQVLALAKQLLEFIVAHLRAMENVSIFANIRGDSAESIAQRMFTRSVIGGLQGPTLSPVITRQGEKWFATNLIVRKDRLVQAIAELREVGGSGVVVTPVVYIFEEEPDEITNMLAALEDR